jgi:hypothetical protein
MEMLSDIASQISDLSKIFKEKYGFETLSYHDDINSPINKRNVDVNLSLKKQRINKYIPKTFNRLRYYLYEKIDAKYYNKAKNECDVFIFFWKTFKYDFSDLEELRNKGKKIIICFTGNEARWYPAHKQQFERYGLDLIEYEHLNLSSEALLRKLHYIRNAEKFADAIYSRLDQHQLGLRPYYRWNMMVNLKEFNKSDVFRAKTPIITHAPSKRAFKGTKHILSVLEKMKNEGLDFEIQLVEGVPHEKAVKMYSNSDIVIDQILCPGSGKLATECLAMGKVVVGRMAYNNYPQNFGKYKDYPIVDARIDTLYEVLKELILNPEKRKDIANRSRRFVKSVLDYEYFCDDIVKIVKGESIRKEDYQTSFFYDFYKPENNEEEAIHNKCINLVKECDWYQELYSTKERNGLRF